jgi:hypothetical protein
MSQSECPTNETAIEKMSVYLKQISRQNKKVSAEIDLVNKNISKGKQLIKESCGVTWFRGSYGRLERIGGKRNSNKYKHKYIKSTKKGGMPPKRSGEDLTNEPSTKRAAIEEMISETAVELDTRLTEALAMDEQPSSITVGLSHIVASAMFLGGAHAMSCYFWPNIEAFLIGRGLLPVLCTRGGISGLFERGINSLASYIGSESCGQRDVRYHNIVMAISALPAVAGLSIAGLSKIFNTGFLPYTLMQKFMLYIFITIIKFTKKMYQMATAPRAKREEEVKAAIDEVIEEVTSILEDKLPEDMTVKEAVGPELETLEDQLKTILKRIDEENEKCPEASFTDTQGSAEERSALEGSADERSAIEGSADERSADERSDDERSADERSAERENGSFPPSESGNYTAGRKMLRSYIKKIRTSSKKIRTSINKKRSSINKKRSSINKKRSSINKKRSSIKKRRTTYKKRKTSRRA